MDATPYINHPLDVARILTEAGVEDVEVLMAGILHDTIEDTNTTAEELVERFGAYIQFAEMVAGGCAGVNERLDAMLVEAVKRLKAGEGK